MMFNCARRRKKNYFQEHVVSNQATLVSYIALQNLAFIVCMYVWLNFFGGERRKTIRWKERTQSYSKVNQFP